VSKLWNRVRPRLTVKNITLSLIQMVSICATIAVFIPFVYKVLDYQFNKGRIEVVSSSSMWGRTMEEEVENFVSLTSHSSLNENGYSNARIWRDETVRLIDKWELEMVYSKGSEADPEYAQRAAEPYRNKVASAMAGYRQNLVGMFGKEGVAQMEADTSITAYRAEPSKTPVYYQLLISYLLSCVTMWPFLICKPLKRGKYKMWYEFMPHRSPFAAVIWWAAAKFYPLESPVDATLKALRFAAGIVISILSLGAAHQMFGQSTSKKSGKRQKTDSSYVVTTNQRAMPIGDGIETAHRVTILKDELGVENVFTVTANPRGTTLTNTLTPMLRIFRNKNATVNLLGGWRHVHSDPKTPGLPTIDQDLVVGGAQIFLKNDRLSALTPMLRVEKPLNGPANSPSIFGWNMKARVKLGDEKKSHWWAGIDALVRKPLRLGSPTSWTIGGVFDYQKPKWLLGGGIFRNQAGAMGFRGEFQYTF
jgi:hypothetical protein